MDLFDFTGGLHDMLAVTKSIFLRTEPEESQFTDSRNLVVWGGGARIDLQLTPQDIVPTFGQLDLSIFSKERVDRIYCWNLKSLASYFHYHTKRFLSPQNQIYDLSVIERFLGLRKPAPASMSEVVERLKACLQNPSWKPIYQSIHLPLILQVLPSLETTGLQNKFSRITEYPFYEIEGQTNGRLNCGKLFPNTYIPHVITPEMRKNLRPVGENLRFVVADYRCCEAVVLAWLSKDPKLQELIDSGKDVHQAIYEAVTNNPCDSDSKRSMSKQMFLPVMYGLGPKGLAYKFQISDNNAEELYTRVRRLFSVSYDWITEQQKQAQKGVITDYFGRPRTFLTETDQYCLKARNFVVQAVAATVCQEKLIQLWRALDREQAYLAFSVHDGYGLVCKIPAARDVYKILKSNLESESGLCPGLKLKIEVKFGAKLEELRVLWKD